uniref:Uncharacterized protein n=1 Tax=Lepeophtheirus salmonis TaxID=72036 RepID=A0A0K2T347_LEPSM
MKSIYFFSFIFIGPEKLITQKVYKYTLYIVSN